LIGVRCYGLSGKTIVTFVEISFYRYMRPAKKGDTISIVAECLKVGKTMAYFNVDIFNKSNENKLIAQGRHTKVF